MPHHEVRLKHLRARGSLKLSELLGCANGACRLKSRANGDLREKKRGMGRMGGGKSS